MDILLGLLLLSGLFALFQLLLPGKQGRGIGIAQWITWIALATILVAFFGSGRAGETFNRFTGNFFDRTPPTSSPTVSPIVQPTPIDSQPLPSPTVTLTPLPPPPNLDSPSSGEARRGLNEILSIANPLLVQPSPSPFPAPTPAPTLFPSPSPLPPPTPSPSLSPSPPRTDNPPPPPVFPSASPPAQPPINGLW